MMLKSVLADIGSYSSVQRYVGKYGKPTSQTTALYHLEGYFIWLREKRGNRLTPDELGVAHTIWVVPSKLAGTCAGRSTSNGTTGTNRGRAIVATTMPTIEIAIMFLIAQDKQSLL